jgi:hypothetical protein
VLLVILHYGSRSWPLGEDSFSIGRHFHRQPPAALMTSPHVLLCSPRELLVRSLAQDVLQVPISVSENGG